MEQLPGVFEACKTACGLDSHGPAAGRAWGWQGRRGGAPGVSPANGIIAWRGNTADAMKGLREGLRFGGEDFLERLIERVELKPGEGHGRKERVETGEQKAERIVCEELERLKWRESKGAPQKVEIARRIREETTMSLKWIAIRLKMGDWKHVANKLDQNEKCTDTQRQDFSERACQVK